MIVHVWFGQVKFVFTHPDGQIEANAEVMHWAICQKPIHELATFIFICDKSSLNNTTLFCLIFFLLDHFV